MKDYKNLESPERRKFLRDTAILGGSVLLSGGIVAAGWKLGWFDEKEQNHYNGPWGELDVPCQADSGTMIYDVSKGLVNMPEEAFEEHGWKSEYRSIGYWQNEISAKNPDGFTHTSGGCHLRVPGAYKDSL